MSNKNSKGKKGKGLLSVDAVVAENRRARHDYFIEDTFEAGIQLTGTEVKSLRLGRCSINEAHVAPSGNEIVMHNSHIPEYEPAHHKQQHAPRRARKLLLHRSEINKLNGSVTQKGYTIVPIKLYFNKNGLAKILIGLAKGKKQHDKREDMKQKDWNRSKQRVLREKG